MISVQEVVVDPDVIAPRPFTLLRSVGKFVSGGFQATSVSPIPMFGPVQQATNKEVEMLEEADRVTSVRSFWCTQPVYTTRGRAPVPGVHGEVPQGSGVNYTLAAAPPNNSANVYANGMALTPGVDYALTGTALTLTLPLPLPLGGLYVTWATTVLMGQAQSDQIQYGDEVYRVLVVYHDPGCGYWKALGTRMNAS